MTSRRSLTGLGYVGFPALIFIEMNQYGAKDQTYEEMRRRQHKIYSYLKAYLPEFEDKEGKKVEYNGTIGKMLEEASVRINDTRELYSPLFEGEHTWSDDEKQFQISLDGSFEHLAVIVAMTKVIDNQKIGEDMEVIG